VLLGARLAGQNLFYSVQYGRGVIWSIVKEALVNFGVHQKSGIYSMLRIATKLLDLVETLQRKSVRMLCILLPA
jgi:hypothetical protein